jgi:hypothetical protein
MSAVDDEFLARVNAVPVSPELFAEAVREFTKVAARRIRTSQDAMDEYQRQRSCLDGILGHRSESDNDRFIMGTAIFHRFQALKHLAAELPLPRVKANAKAFHPDVIAAATEEPVIETKRSRIFDSESFQRRLADIAKKREAGV